MLWGVKKDGRYKEGTVPMEGVIWEEGVEDETSITSSPSVSRSEASARAEPGDWTGIERMRLSGVSITREGLLRVVLVVLCWTNVFCTTVGMALAESKAALRFSNPD